jgi:hypothetical protein
MPTGSGKSFLAELAIAHALSKGWVLYLTPTNALAQQVRRDLQRSLQPFSTVHITAFVGGAEYTPLVDGDIEDARFVGVMTPEKCALALRLYPAVFEKCALCVFDECHLLNDPTRGVVADVLMAQLFSAAPAMRCLLMSAMVSNADELAAWLASVRKAETSSANIKWRPSRAARGFVFADLPARDRAKRRAAMELAQARKAMTTSAELPLGLLAGLSGPWTQDGEDDYRACGLPISARFESKRNRKGEFDQGDVPSWKNQTGRAVAELFASRGLPAINFVLTSRHHAFASAEQVTMPMPNALGSTAFPSVIDAQLVIADAELGVPTLLRDLLSKGVAVHTSAMLRVEQAAAESMFASGQAKLMVATGTLAQGLNLPAIAVVVSGSKLPYADPRELDAASGIRRADELILNGFGRAGRPGFANQGIVVLVSDHPFYGPVQPNLDGSSVLNVYPILAKPDSSITITSPVGNFLDNLLADENEQDATKIEVSLTSLLANVDGDDENAGTILRRTFGGYQKRVMFTDAQAAVARARVGNLKTKFLEAPSVPTWMPVAAMRAGVDFFRAQRMWQALKASGLPSHEERTSWTVQAWFDKFIDVLSWMPPTRISEYLDPKPKPRQPSPRTELARLASTIADLDAVPWSRPEGWDKHWQHLGKSAWAYMSGKSYAEIGAILFGGTASSYTSQRRNPSAGLPPVFKFVGDIMGNAMTLDAGCFLAIHQSWLESQAPETPLPDELQALPLCVRHGCDTLNTLAWFRFGFRERVCAHALAAKYPIPDMVSSDVERRLAVRRLRNAWLEEDDSSSALLKAARTIIMDGSSEVA